ncbi:Rv1733c family protein [Rhodococcus sp. IEGM1428]|uniref:Rv1733c family protein n=1 Tax=Rhodococcus sp. IEGM1428 TaxID=3392191 RepID=UPI003D0DCA9D
MIAELVHRWWRRSPWISSPLLRLSDRIERTAVSVGVAILLLLIPVTATVGSVTYSALSLRSQQQRAQNVRVDAHVIDAMKSARSDTDGVTTVAGTATVQWSAPDGSLRSGSTDVPSAVRLGDTTPIWLDANGDLVRAPGTAAGAVVIGAATAVFVWFLGAVVIGGLVFLITRAGDRSRMRHWDRDWQHFLQARDHPSR